MPAAASLYRAYEPITHAYFPESSMVSILANTETGQSTEIGIVGREGAVGLDVVMGAKTLPHDLIVQMPDSGYRIKAEALRKEFDLCNDAQIPILRFIQKLLVQISQTTLCNRLHRVEERLPRWLLMCHDRAEGDNLRLTQEFLAIMLGVARVSITLSASELQSAGYIKYTRGQITILDREALERSSCECYRIVKDEYDRN
ncbi:MAG TPA: Crp/Fnr family transcriptional regulator [Pyrinomonadaceae bacterium]|nr:Crp/Fnr family transcriptional regulator [Pyrinomonadaceae bacterium]